MKLMLLLRVRRERTERKRERTSIRIRVMKFKIILLTKDLLKNNFNLSKMIKKKDKEAIQDLLDLHLTRRTRRLKVPVTIQRLFQIQVPLLTKRRRRIKRRTREKTKKMLRMVVMQVVMQQLMELRET